jgi:protein-tyrosine phosphatase
VEARNQKRPGAAEGLRLRAICASAGLSFLFVTIYGWCNWITGQRQDVGTLYFAWEKGIPFVPLMIVPYLSIDLFFVLAPFFCRDRPELVMFSKRIAFAIIVAGFSFLFFPFRFAFERPHASGWLGGIFDWFRWFDQPYNLVPSLHIALQVILAEHYGRHSRGFWRAASNTWFILIGLSTVLTYQHHVIDVVTGLILGICCIYLIRGETANVSGVGNPRIGLLYGLGAAIAFAFVLVSWPWGALLVWPAAALAIISLGYFRFGSRVFWKEAGRLHWSARAILIPGLLGQQLSLTYYRRQCRAWDEVTPSLWIGRVLNHREANEAVRAGVTAVLDLTAEFSEPEPLRSLTYCNVPILDLTAPTIRQLRQMVEFIETESARGIVYVHCKIGYSRTAAATAAYLLQTGKAETVAEAAELLRQARPSLVVRPEVDLVLREFVSTAERETGAHC